MARKRYGSQDPDLEKLIGQALERAQEIHGVSEDADLVRQILVTATRLVQDGAAARDLKLLNSALKELRHAFRVFAPYSHQRKVAVFGSARTEPDAPDWDQARSFAERIVEAGWMVITGAGSGIMAAAQGGAGREASFGVNIRLPFEQRANEVIEGDHKCINFRYFFTRKVVFVKEAHAIALFPGGFGTHDEAAEALTLIQTGKSEVLPVVFVDEPGGSYWKEWHAWMVSHVAARGFLSPEDLSLFRVTDDIHEAVGEILKFYSNYHSTENRGSRLVLRVRKEPGDKELDALNTQFADIVARGSIDRVAPRSVGNGEGPSLAGVGFEFDRRSWARLRQMIDTLNQWVDAEASPPLDASPLEIVQVALSERAEAEEEA
ncbi:MAG: LOG family protein [Myxococcota bacterium]|nr:LOG family protein [Myxococcota bacterium]